MKTYRRKAAIIRRGKYELRIHHKLSNGQNISMFAFINKYNYKPTPYFIARIGLVISNNRRSCNDWHKSRHNKRTKKLLLQETGRTGLEGLLWAKKMLKELEPYLLEKYNLPLWIKVGWINEQRQRVYRRLEKDGYFFTNWHGDDCLMKTLRDYSYNND
jgi:hypothetical protein